MSENLEVEASIDQKEIEKTKDRTEQFTCSLFRTASSINELYGDRLDYSQLVKTMIGKVKKVTLQDNLREVELMLVGHLEVLDALFHQSISMMVDTRMVNQTQVYSDIAFKAQKQWRQTAAFLADLKNPNRTTFIKQQNIAMNQQINNDSQPENLKKTDENELLNISEVKHAALDTGGAITPIPVNSEVEAMENSWCENSRRQGN